MMPFSFVNSLWVLMARGWNYLRMQHIVLLDRASHLLEDTLPISTRKENNGLQYLGNQIIGC